jgi:hypothetical protein
MPPVVTLVAWAALALWAAGAAQVAWGRTDVRRGHRALSAVLWIAMLVGLAGFEAYTQRLLNPGWDELISIDEVQPAPRGEWSAVTGQVRGRGRVPWLFLAKAAAAEPLLLESVTGRRWPVAAPEQVAFAPNGRRAACVAFSPWSSEAVMSVLDLDQRPLRARTWELSGEPAAGQIPVAFSPDGSRLLALARHTALIFDVDGERPPLRVPLPPGRAMQATFLEERRVRLFQERSTGVSTGTLHLLDLDVGSGALVEVGRIATRGNAWVRVSADGTRMLVLDRPDHQPTLTLHAADGSLLATLTEQGAATNMQADFLADGRIAVLQKDTVARLRLMSVAGADERALALGDDRTSSARLGTEPAPGRLTVGLSLNSRHQRETVLVDVTTGTVRQRYPGLLPADVRWFTPRDAASRPAAGSLATRLFRDARGEVVALDPDTGQRKAAFVRGGTSD